MLTMLEMPTTMTTTPTIMLIIAATTPILILTTTSSLSITATITTATTTTKKGSGATAFLWWNRLASWSGSLLSSSSTNRCSNPSPTRFHRSGFLPVEQFSPAGLLRMLLLRAGIESNPGPKIWICEICNKRVNKTHYSVRCRTCCKWTHLNNCATNLGSYYLCNNCPHPTTITSSPVRGAQPHRPIICNKTSATPNINPISHSDSKLNILQFNCNDLKNKNKSAEIAHHLSIHNISIAALQETKLSTRSAVPVFKNYAIYRKDRKSGRGGGLMMLIHHKIPYTIKQLPDTDTTESQGITIMADGTEINIVNVYIPPQFAFPPHFCASIVDLLEFPNIILLGDLNAHDGLWYSGISDARGETLAAEIDDSDCCTLNLDSPTRLPSNKQKSFFRYSYTIFGVQIDMLWLCPEAKIFLYCAYLLVPCLFQVNI
ncbi:hypothetical protein HELRODRAFT_174237 [Helobdella robusta]|uniref:Endonuclease/exonuclease/phosphatase domain-containing protein n=1 Tax=Helobdella robusta TaxID=6412 RepID=T1F7U8_HELRO|nr:hypothetical protein HELRODRAFT_174237 [Helobdella robusta]ESO02814.1 hypothetical protein HELRODRAFT_174237 [Helobdella robusta]